MRATHRPVLATQRQSRVRAAVGAAAGVGSLVTALQRRPSSPLGGAVRRAGTRRARPAPAAAGTAASPEPVCRPSSPAACWPLLAFLGVDSFIPLAVDRIHGESPDGAGLHHRRRLAELDRRPVVRRPAPDIGAARACDGDSATIALGMAADVPVVRADWPLWVAFVTWSVGGLGMGLLFNPTTVAAMSTPSPAARESSAARSTWPTRSGSR